MKLSVIGAIVSVGVLFAPDPVCAGPIMYGGLGGHSISSGPGASANDGSLAIFDQTTGAVTIIGHPAGVARLSGLAFDSNGVLYGATQVAGGFPPPPGPTGGSSLVRLNPNTGSLLSSMPIIAATGGLNISIADLAVQPGTDVLFGIRSPLDQQGGQGRLYTISKTTGVANLVGTPGIFSGASHLRRTARFT